VVAIFSGGDYEKLEHRLSPCQAKINKFTNVRGTNFGEKKEQNKAIGGGTLFMAFGIQTGNQGIALRYRNSTFIRLVFVQKKGIFFKKTRL